MRNPTTAVGSVSGAARRVSACGRGAGRRVPLVRLRRRMGAICHSISASDLPHAGQGATVQSLVPSSGQGRRLAGELRAARPAKGLCLPARRARLHLAADRRQVRRDCLDHVVVFGERHLHHLLKSYQNTTTKHARTCHCKRTRRSPVRSRPSVRRWPCRSWVGCTINISECEFPTRTEGRLPYR
jgi:hypothetical protein